MLETVEQPIHVKVALALGWTKPQVNPTPKKLYSNQGWGWPDMAWSAVPEQLRAPY